MSKPQKYFSHPSAIIETSKIGKDTRVWGFTHIMKNVVIGDDCNIGGNCFIESGTMIGNNVVVKNGISIWSGVKIEDRVFLGPSVVLTNDKNPRSGFQRPLLKTIFREGSSIGAGAIILPGIEIGKYCMVGAGALVTKSTLPYSLMMGSPAKQIGWVCDCGLKLQNPSLKCFCGKKFKLKAGTIIEL